MVRLLSRVHALQAFVTTDDGTNLLAGYKRAANILKKEGVEGDQSWTAPTYTLEPAEADLIAALDAANAADAAREVTRIRTFLDDSDPTAAAAIEQG